MTTPSFIFVPSVYKQGLIYAELPADGSGDLTVSRGSVATRFNEDGNIELLVRNLCFNSQDWTSNWSANGVTVGANSTVFTAPNGGPTANAIVPTATNAVHRLSSNSTTAISYVSGQVYTASAHFAAGRGAAGRYVQLTLPSGAFSQGGFANFDLVDGTVTLVGGGTDANRSASIVNVGGGWFRCVFTATCNVTASTTGENVVLITAPNATLAPTFLGSTGDLLFGWGAQVEDGSAVSEYQRADTGRFNIPRLDYLQSDGTVGCPALLVEPSAQNALQRSSEFDNAYWGKQSGANVTLNDAISPDGTLNADRINLVSGSTISRVERAGLAYLASTDYTLSFFLKNIALTAGQTFAIRLEGSGGFDLVGTVTLFSNTISVALTGTAGTGFVSGSQKSTVENYGNGWYRYSISLRTGTTAGNATVYLITNVDANRSFHAWGAQLEVGSVATSYIPTTTAPITRSADIITKTGATALIGQTEGTIYAEVDVRNFTNSARVIALSDGTGANAINLQLLAPDRIRVTVNLSSIDQADFNAVMPAGVNKLALGYAQNNIALYLNGTRVGTKTSCNIPATNKVELGSLNGETILNNRIRASALFTSRLTAEELIIRTAPIYNENLADSIWENYLARPSLSTELPECLRARHNEIITI